MMPYNRDFVVERHLYEDTIHHSTLSTVLMAAGEDSLIAPFEANELVFIPSPPGNLCDGRVDRVILITYEKPSWSSFQN